MRALPPATSVGKKSATRTSSISSEAVPAPPTSSGGAPVSAVTNDPYLADGGSAVVTQDPYDVAEDPDPAPEVPAPIAVPVSAPRPAPPALPPAKPARAAVAAKVPPKQIVVAEEDDLYGDVAAPE